MNNVFNSLEFFLIATDEKAQLYAQLIHTICESFYFLSSDLIFPQFLNKCDEVGEEERRSREALVKSSRDA